jgi:hypothetical protein
VGVGGCNGGDCMRIMRSGRVERSEE